MPTWLVIDLPYLFTMISKFAIFEHAEKEAIYYRWLQLFDYQQNRGVKKIYGINNDD